MGTLIKKTPSEQKFSKTTLQRAGARRPAKARKAIGSTGTYVAKGYSAKPEPETKKLVGRFPELQIQGAPGKPKHFSPAEINEMAKMMKVA